MSVRVMSWVFEHSQARGNDRLVLLAIADRCDDDGGNCWKSTEKLAAKAMVSKRTAQRSIDHLVALGELAVEERPGTTNMLAVVMGRQIDAPASGGQETGGANLTPLGVTPVTPRQVDAGDTRVQGGWTTVSTDTSFSHPTTPQPPASGGQNLAHCKKHSRYRRGCENCDLAVAAAKAKPTWCGQCDERTRLVEAADGSPKAHRCPRCHPLQAVAS